MQKTTEIYYHLCCFTYYLISMCFLTSQGKTSEDFIPLAEHNAEATPEASPVTAHAGITLVMSHISFVTDIHLPAANKLVILFPYKVFKGISKIGPRFRQSPIFSYAIVKLFKNFFFIKCICS